MDITYFVVQGPIQVGDEFRMPGQLIPEARDWSHLWAYLQRGEVAPVLVATLPKDTQEMLAAWEKAQEVTSAPVATQPEPDEDEESEDGDKGTEEEAAQAAPEAATPHKGSQKVKG